MSLRRWGLVEDGQAPKLRDAPADLRALQEIGVEWLTAIATLAGAVLYLALRAITGRFYASFGLTLEDVGLGEGSLLARSAGGLILIGGIGITGIASLVGSAQAVPRWARDGTAPLRWSVFVAVAVAMIAASLLLLAAHRDDAWRFVAFLVITGAACSVVGAVFGGSISSDQRGLRRVAVSLFAVLTVATAVQLWVVAGRDAHAVLTGKPFREDLAGVPLTAYNAVAARMSDGTCVMFLGASSGAVFVYDRNTADEPVRRLSSDTELSIDPGRHDHCDRGG
jgi:hypothetical protein